MHQFYTSVMDSPIGKLGIKMDEKHLAAVQILPPETKLIKNASAKEIEAELLAYFENPEHQFNVSTSIKGTPFQIRVWKMLQKIASGSTLTYGDIAKALESGPRAVGQACRRNPLLLIVPCHRVVHSQHLGGFAGQIAGHFTDAKKWLLEHETPSLRA